MVSTALIRELLGATGQEAVQDVRLGALTTTSLPALRAYLEGEAAFRDANFAAALVDRLPARDRVLVEASEAARTGDASFYPTIREVVALYPDDPDLWFELGECIYHAGVNLGLASWAQAMEAFEKAVELDPDFGPYQVHPLELTIAEGDRADAEARLARYREATEDERNITEFSLAIPILLGDSAELRQALETSLTTDVELLHRIRIAYTNKVDQYDRLREMLWANRYLRARAETSEFSAQAADLIEGTIAAEEGRVADAHRLLGPVARTTGNPASLARISVAEVELGEGNTTEAIRFYTGELDSYNRFHASLALARVYDERADADLARTYYERFLRITRAGDQDLPEILEAKAALARLGG